MVKAVGQINRHTAQGRPDKDKENSGWLFSLMNRGQDPLK